MEALVISRQSSFSSQPVDRHGRFQDVGRAQPYEATQVLNGRHQQKLFGGSGETMAD